MNYLFFDIECTDGNRAVCEYGCVLTSGDSILLENEISSWTLNVYLI